MSDGIDEGQNPVSMDETRKIDWCLAHGLYAQQLEHAVIRQPVLHFYLQSRTSSSGN